MFEHNNNQNNKAINQLIILGNGFDLSCGLKSSYFDFFHSRFTEIAGQNKIKEYYEEKVLSQISYKLEKLPKNITFWDLIFISEYYNAVCKIKLEK